jgi:hypothetical protein
MGRRRPAARIARGDRCSLVDHVEGADLRAARRHHCRAVDLAAGVGGRVAQLGLPFLLAAGCYADAAFTHDAGYYDEARAWRNWLLRAAAGSPEQIQIMYGVTGSRWLPEHEVPWLDGYEKSKPVRVGNAAADQLQLDVYGEVMDALHRAHVGGVQHLAAAWDFVRSLLAHLETVWRNPDDGIWEVRGGRQHFTHSKVMAWVAFDRAIKSVESFGLEGPVEHWRRLRAEIHEEVCRRAFNKIGAFTQAYDSDLLDASTLLIPQVGFLPPDDSRVQGTIAAIERKLLHNGFVLRYDTAATEDGLPPGEGAFLPASFWLADAYVMIGRIADAQRLFDRLVGLCNDVGLLAEEYDVRRSALARQFPAGILTHRAGEYSIQYRPWDQAVRAALRASAARHRRTPAPIAGRSCGGSHLTLQTPINHHPVVMSSFESHRILIALCSENSLTMDRP